jgi:hypothetical protein
MTAGIMRSVANVLPVYHKALTLSDVVKAAFAAAFCLALAACSDGSDNSVPARLVFESNGFFRVENDGTIGGWSIYRAKHLTLWA